MQTIKSWFGEASWQKVVSVNQSQCQAQDVPHQYNSKHLDAQNLWEANFTRKTSLRQALDLCRQCNDLRPFLYNCSNTFTSLGKSIVEDWAQRLGSVDAHILRTTVAHYIESHIHEKELTVTLKYLESKPQSSEIQAKTQAPIIASVQRRQLA